MDRELLTDEELKMLRMPTKPACEQTDSSSPPPPTPKQDQRLIDLHVEFGTRLVEILGEVSRRELEVRLRDEWLGSYSEFVLGQSIPTCCAVISSKLRDLEFYLVVDPKVLYPMLDRLLGSRITEPVPNRPMTEIEQQVARLLLTEIIDQYRSIWQRALSLDLVLERIEHNTQSMHGIRGSDATYHVRYEVSFENTHGLLEICLPWERTEQLRGRLAAA